MDAPRICSNCGFDAKDPAPCCPVCGSGFVAPSASIAGENCASSTGYVPALESAEFLIVKWEAKAEELEHMAAEYRQSLTGLVAMTLEKARAYRTCIEELRRHAEATSVRQPGHNVVPVSRRLSND